MDLVILNCEQFNIIPFAFVLISERNERKPQIGLLTYLILFSKICAERKAENLIGRYANR